jgi:hypothetical protein
MGYLSGQQGNYINLKKRQVKLYGKMHSVKNKEIESKKLMLESKIAGLTSEFDY